MNLFSWLPSGIARRIAGTTVTLSLALVALLGTMSYWYIRSLLQEGVRAELEQEADHVSVHLGELLSGINEDLRNLTANALIANSMFDREGRERYLVPFLATYQFPEQVPFVLTLFDRQGRPLASNFPLPVAATPLAAEVRQGVFGQDRFYAEVRRESDLWVLVLAYPVVPPAARNAQGVLVSEVVIADLLKRSVHGMASFGDCSLTVACCGETIWSSGAPAGGITVTRELALDRSRPALDRLQLVLTVQAPADLERAPLRRLTAIYAAVGLAVLLLTLAVARTLARRISGPIVALSSAADRVARGGALDERIEPQGRDEVAALAGAFNTMLTQLRSLTLDLERRVKERTERLRQEKLFSETVIDSLPGVFFMLDREGRVLRWSRNVERATGYAGEELSRLKAFDLTPPEDRGLVGQRLGEAFASGSATVEAHLLLKNGERPPYFFSASRFSLHGQELIIGTGLDLSAQKHVEEELRKSEEKFRTLIESTSDWIWEIDANGVYTYASPKIRDILGYEPAEVLGRSPFDLMTPGDASRLGPKIAAIISERRAFHGLENANRHKDGRLVVLETSGVPFFGKDGRWMGYRGIDRDITERTLARETFQALLRTTMDGFLLMDVEGRILDVNAALCDLLGYRRDDLLALGVRDIEAAHSADEIGRRIERVQEHGKERFESRMLRSDRSIVDVEVSMNYSPEGGGRLMGFVRDITERKASARALEELNRTLQQRVDAEVAANREKDRLMMVQARQAALGEVLENIAHQWRQPLNSIGLIIQDLEDAQRSGELTEDYLQQRVRRAMDVVQHMSQTIDSFRRFYRPDRERTTFTLNGAVARVLAFLESSFRTAGIRVSVTMDEELPVEGHPNELAQVLLNILNNARDVLLERKVAEPRVTIHVGRADGRPSVTVADNGGGIPPGILDRLFDPYVTTKEEGRGTGIGLYLSRTIIEKNMGGSLTARNTAEGAEFRIRL